MIKISPEIYKQLEEIMEDNGLTKAENIYLTMLKIYKEYSYNNISKIAEKYNISDKLVEQIYNEFISNPSLLPQQRSRYSRNSYSQSDLGFDF